jgi:hypothetical protein
MPLQGLASGGSGVTGRQSSVRAAVLPTMQVGGATLSNVVLVVIDDANLRLGSGPDAYQIDAILGYPVFKALGIITFRRDEFLAGDGAAGNGRDTRMYMRGLGPVIECDVEGRPLLFTFDSGASSTDLSVRYYELFRAQAGSWKTQNFESAGVGGSIRQTEYIQPHVAMKVGTSTVTLKDVSIFPVRMNTAIDLLFGNLGQDFVDSVESVSLNFSTMTFSIGAARNDR